MLGKIVYLFLTFGLSWFGEKFIDLLLAQYLESLPISRVSVQTSFG